MLLEIQSIGAGGLKPCWRHEIRNQHIVDEVSQVVSFDCIANFKRIDFAVAAECAPVDPRISQHFE
jgi:hypothetical protein